MVVPTKADVIELKLNFFFCCFDCVCADGKHENVLFNFVKEENLVSFKDFLLINYEVSYRLARYCLGNLLGNCQSFVSNKFYVKIN